MLIGFVSKETIGYPSISVNNDKKDKKDKKDTCGF